MNETRLSRLRRKKDFYTNGPDWVRSIWTRFESFHWFVKRHRRHLAETGATVGLGRDTFIDVELFPNVSLQILGLGEGVGHEELQKLVVPHGRPHV